MHTYKVHHPPHQWPTIAMIWASSAIVAYFLPLAFKASFASAAALAFFLLELSRMQQKQIAIVEPSADRPNVNPTMVADIVTLKDSARAHFVPRICMSGWRS